LLAVGCGTEGYETRMSTTLANKKYDRKLDENLAPPVSKGMMQQLHVYLRPPRNMPSPTQTFQMTVVEPGQFDLENSFIDPETQESLHVLVRDRTPKPANKKAAPTPAEAAPRGDFNTQVIELLRNAYGVDLDSTKFKDEPVKNPKSNRSKTFKHSGPLLAGNRYIDVYLYGGKEQMQDVALIFDYPQTDNAIKPAIRLCLESFATGRIADLSFSGGEEDEAGDGSGEGGAAPVAF
jgi:hypothetical protein